MWPRVRPARAGDLPPHAPDAAALVGAGAATRPADGGGDRDRLRGDAPLHGSRAPLTRRPFRYALDPLCLLAVAAFATNRWWIEPRVAPPSVFHGYWNDLICIAFWLPPALWVERRLGLRRHDRPPTAAEAGRYVLVWSVLFECLAPRLTARATADALDVAAYAAGALLAWLWWNRPTAERRERRR